MAFVFAATIFLSASLLFVVEPLISRIVLPRLGGAPSVWNTCVLFFQAALLAAYALVHWITSRWDIRAQRIAILVLGVATCLSLPLSVEHQWLPPAPTEQNPVWWLICFLALTIGLPFMLLSMVSPLLQHWFTGGTHARASDPYFLYAASNLGSLLALLAYPALIEPLLPITKQTGFWTYGFYLMLPTVYACSLLISPKIERDARIPSGVPYEKLPRVTDRPRHVQWLILAFIPSSLMLGATTHLSTDIASIPLLWVIPLAIYLLTFVIAFARYQVLPPAWVARCMPGMVILVVVLLLAPDMQPPLLAVLLMHLAALFVVALYCHQRLAADRPDPGHLTEYYFCLAAGGALGGVFNALAAPLLFQTVLEYPLVLILACLMRQPFGSSRNKRLQTHLDWMLPLGLGVLVMTMLKEMDSATFGLPQAYVALVFGVPAIICYTFVDRPVRFAAGLAMLLLAGSFYAGVQGKTVYAVRSFFGAHRVTIDSQGAFHQLVHGNTIHGRQSLSPDRRREPLSYYYRSGPAGILFEAFSGKWQKADVAAIGLGAGSLACYAKPGQKWTFYEIDPAVQRIAENPELFTFLTDCRAQNLRIVLGDGRLRIMQAPDHSYDVVILDAFSSDAVPVHLLTREALQVYRHKLKPGGLLVFHISNRYLDLKPVLTGLAEDAGLLSRFYDDLEIDPAEAALGKDPSQWAVFAAQHKDFGTLLDAPRWRAPATSSCMILWTDDYSSILSILKREERY